MQKRFNQNRNFTWRKFRFSGGAISGSRANEQANKKINMPNPIIIKAIADITDNFIWNWDDLLESYKLVA